jgi:hypothetical protein
MMEWEAIAAIGEMIGGAAVVVSIVYLSAQIRANTRATKANASFDATHSWALSNEYVHQMSDEVLAAFQRGYHPDARSEDFTEIERIRMAIHIRALFQKLEGQYYLFRYGFLEPDVWSKRSAWASGLIQLPFWQQWWQAEIEENVYTDAFVEAIESASPVRVSLSGGDRFGGAQ